MDTFNKTNCFPDSKFLPAGLRAVATEKLHPAHSPYLLIIGQIKATPSPPRAEWMACLHFDIVIFLSSRVQGRMKAQLYFDCCPHVHIPVITSSVTEMGGRG